MKRSSLSQHPNQRCSKKSCFENSQSNNTSRYKKYMEIKKIIKDEYQKCFTIEEIETSESTEIELKIQHGYNIDDGLSKLNIAGNLKKNDKKKDKNIFFTSLQTTGSHKYVIANKIINNEGINELTILQKLHNYALINYTIHFPFFYSQIKCALQYIQKDDEHAIILEEIKLPYIIILSEKADGDFTNYITNKIFATPNEGETLIVQLLLCILTLHSVNIIHKDINGGNFLYHIDTSLKSNNIYIKYNINYENKNSTVYIKIYNKIIWTLWDFETSKEISEETSEEISDYSSFIQMIKLFNKKELIENLSKIIGFNIQEIQSPQYDTIIMNIRKKIIEYIIKYYSVIPQQNDSTVIIYNDHEYKIKI